MMDAVFISGVCRRCPHSRFVGGEPPNWRVQLCLYKGDLSTGDERRSTSVDDLRSLETCPDKARAARYAGVGT